MLPRTRLRFVRPCAALLLWANPFYAAAQTQPGTPAPAAAKPKPAAPGTVAPSPEGWPREFKSSKTTFTIYQPQLESWDGSRMQAYSAVAAKIGDQKNPSYGVIYFSARTDVDKIKRLVYLADYKLERVHFPATPEREAELTQVLKTGTAKTIKTISLDRFEASLAVTQAQKQARVLPIKNDPPKIVFQIVPGMLVIIDGQPAWRPVPGTKLQRAINTRPLLLKDEDGKLFLHVFDGWMSADSLQESWGLAKKKPGDLEKVLEAARKNPQIDLLEGDADPDTKQKPKLEKGKIPYIVVATVPTELVISNGEWSWAAILGTRLEYVSNTTGHIFRDTSDSKLYVLISGRWFRATNRSGPWEFVHGGGLPEDFKAIPDDSPKENVKASVPDTPQAEEAVIANLIPQTAEIKRAEAKLTPPLFDGDPQLKPIEGTPLEYVINSPTPIVKVNASSFYAVENGAWFTGKTVKGPWTLADTIPTVIYTIPPSSPLHYVTYVRVYQVKKDTVTVGYTPGYYGSMMTTGSGYMVVYGTGYYYPAWVGTYWYGPPVTYGFGTSITYTPWTGWVFGFGFGWSYGAATVGWGWGCYPWWGPVGWGWYYPPMYMGGVAWGPRGVAAWGPYGGWAATTGNVYGRWGNTAYVGRASAGYNPWTGNQWASRTGASYNSRTGTLAAGQRAAVGNVYTGNYAYGGRGAATNERLGVSASGGRVTVGNAGTGNQATVGRGQITNDRTGNTTNVGRISGEQGSVGRVGDNVFASKDGNVYRKNGDSWQEVNRGNWENTRNSQQIQNLNRESAARSQGYNRTQSFDRSSYSRGGGGGYRGGGGRRR